MIKSILLALLLSGLSTYASDETVKAAQPAEANAVVWPTKLPAQIYVLPVTIEASAIADAKKKNAEGISILPSDDEDSAKEKLADLKKDLTDSILEKIKDANLSARIWTGTGLVPPDGWKLESNVVNLDPGKKVIGTDNPVVGIVTSVSDSANPAGKPFLVFNSSVKAKVAPGPGLSPFAKVGNFLAKTTGLQDAMQIERLADSVIENLTEAMKSHNLLQKGD
ncbi:MAG: hypothetical protein NTZ01_02145 [Verrucomicrobia bacterium]|nr:hypothetical protein [Verrucomicrobiota bacterium]